MHRRFSADDAWDDDASEADDFGVDPSDADEPTMQCPYCHREIFEDSPQCPHCGQYIVEDDLASGGKPWWIVVGVLLCLAAILVWIVSL